MSKFRNLQRLKQNVKLRIFAKRLRGGILPSACTPPPTYNIWLVASDWKDQSCLKYSIWQQDSKHLTGRMHFICSNPFSASEQNPRLKLGYKNITSKNITSLPSHNSERLVRHGSSHWKLARMHLKCLPCYSHELPDWELLLTRTGGVFGSSWYWRILSSLVSCNNKWRFSCPGSKVGLGAIQVAGHQAIS